MSQAGRPAAPGGGDVPFGGIVWEDEDVSLGEIVQAVTAWAEDKDQAQYNHTKPYAASVPFSHEDLGEPDDVVKSWIVLTLHDPGATQSTDIAEPPPGEYLTSVTFEALEMEGEGTHVHNRVKNITSAEPPPG